MDILTKKKVNKTIKNLSDTFTIDELIEERIFMERVEEGYQQSEKSNLDPDLIKIHPDFKELLSYGCLAA